MSSPQSQKRAPGRQTVVMSEALALHTKQNKEKEKRDGIIRKGSSQLRATKVMPAGALDSIVNNYKAKGRRGGAPENQLSMISQSSEGVKKGRPQSASAAVRAYDEGGNPSPTKTQTRLVGFSNAAKKVAVIPDLPEIGLGDDVHKEGNLRDATHRIRRFEDMCLGMERRSDYNDQKGPVKPGFHFYKWLAMGSPLQIPIADTILVDNTNIFLVKNDANGVIVRDRPAYENSQYERERFLSDCIKRFVVDSRPMGNSPSLASLKGRFVAVVKRPVGHGKALVSNNIECLTPLAFQAHLADTFDQRAGNFAVQKFIKGRGTKASVYRVFWKADAVGAGASGTVSGWYITKSDDEYLCYDEETMDPARISSKKRDQDEEAGNENKEQHGSGASKDQRRIYSSDEIEQNLSAARAANSELIHKMLSTPDMGSLERGTAQRHGGHANKICGPVNTCTISGERGQDIDQKTCAGLVVMKVSRPALEEVRIYIERLVSWIQNTVNRMEDLVLHLSRVVCDFIRDDQGQWWFIQLKSFQISRQSIPRCIAWYNYKKHGIPREKRQTPAEIRAKLDAERGYKCRLCDLNFQEGQTIHVEVSERDLLAQLGRTSDAPMGHRTKKHSSHKRMSFLTQEDSEGARKQRGDTRSVPAFGYELSRKMACHLAEFYRDEGFPLTKFSRSVLTGEAHVMESRSVAEKLRELEEIELKKSSSGELTCCFFCFQIMEERGRGEARCQALYKLLGCQRAIRQSQMQTQIHGTSELKGGNKYANSANATRTDPSLRNTRIRPSTAPAAASPGRYGATRGGGKNMAGRHNTGSRGGAEDSDGDVDGEVQPLLVDEDLEQGLYRNAVMPHAKAAANLVRSVSLMYRLHARGYYESLSMGARKHQRSLTLTRTSADTASVTSADNWLGGISDGPAAAPTRGPTTDLPGLRIFDTDGGFGYEKWTSKHFKENTYQFRMFVMAHYLTDLKLPEGSPLKGSMSCLSYTLGQNVYHCPFVTESVQDSDLQDLIQIKQCRVHYLCGGLDDVRDYFKHKSLDFTLFHETVDDALLGEEAYNGADTVRAPVEAGFVSISLESLRAGSYACREGTEKIDCIVPLEVDMLGITATLRVSVALVRDESLPWQLAEVSAFLRDGDVFWPPAQYHDTNPLPTPWLYMLRTRPAPLPPTTDKPEAFQREQEQEQEQDQDHEQENSGEAATEKERREREGIGAEATATAAAAGILIPESGADSGGSSVTSAGRDSSGVHGQQDASNADYSARQSLEQGLHQWFVKCARLFKEQVKGEREEQRKREEKEKAESILAGIGEDIGAAGRDRGSSSSGRPRGIKRRSTKAKTVRDTIRTDNALSRGMTLVEVVEEEEEEEEDDEGEGGISEQEHEEEEDEEEDEDEDEDEDESDDDDDDDDSNYDYDDEVLTYGIIRRVFEALRTAEVEFLTRKKQPSKSHEHVRMAIEQLLQQEHLPQRVGWTGFKYLLKECLVWSKTQGTLINVAAQAPAENDIKDPSAELQIGVKVLNRDWVRQSEATISELATLYPHRDIDVTFSDDELSTLTSTATRVSDASAGGALSRVIADRASQSAKKKAELAALTGNEALASQSIGLLSPSSLFRKKRRLMLGLAIYRLAGGAGGDADQDTIDVAELRYYLESERDKLRKFVSLFLEGVVNFPIMLKSYLVSIQDDLCLERFIMCCHLLTHSNLLRQLFDTYESNGTALISKAGLLKAVEEANYHVSNRIRGALVAQTSSGNADSVMDELKVLASEKNAYKRKKEKGTGTLRATFHLGLSAEDDNKDLSDLGEKRRSSIVAMAGAVKDVETEPPVLFLECGEHGVERFFLSDLCCVQCEREELLATRRQRAKQ